MTSTNPILNVSAIDGRYKSHTKDLSLYFSEWAYIRYRVEVEIEWLIFLNHPLKPKIDADDEDFLRLIYKNFTTDDGGAVKAIERETNHDVKAIEYFIRRHIVDHDRLSSLSEWIHFGLTSDDVNNVAHALMHRDAMTKLVLPKLQCIESMVAKLVLSYRSSPLMARTHGQPATPTTFGKEMAVFLNRMMDVREENLQPIKYKAKLNGATGGFNTFVVAEGTIDWESESKQFVEKVLGLTYQPVSTQIEPHDYLANTYRSLQTAIGPMLDLSTDCWLYIMQDLLKLKVIAGEIGSSTMPHKVNPINFENAEANFGITSALLGHIATKLQSSRLQRDLSDSSTLRATGTAFGHLMVALSSLEKGLSKVSFDETYALNELERSQMLLAEPIQTVMRMHCIDNAYEKLKDLTRGAVDHDEMKKKMAELITSLETEMPPSDIATLRNLSPSAYIGKAPEIATKVYERWSASVERL